MLHLCFICFPGGEVNLSNPREILVFTLKLLNNHSPVLIFGFTIAELPAGRINPQSMKGIAADPLIGKWKPSDLCRMITLIVSRAYYHRL